MRCFDVSGAGDTVIATLAAGMAGGLQVTTAVALAAGMAGGLQVTTAVELANLAAGIVVGKVGTVPIAQHELIATLTPSSGVTAGEKILDLERMVTRVAEWRAAGETIVFTNGCFDLLHVGHIALLRTAEVWVEAGAGVECRCFDLQVEGAVATNCGGA